VPQRKQVENHGRACTHSRPFPLLKGELGFFFHFLEIVTDWLVPSAGQKIIPVQPGWYLPPLKKTHLLKNRFCFTQVKGAENTKRKKKIQALLYVGR